MRWRFSKLCLVAPSPSMPLKFVGGLGQRMLSRVPGAQKDTATDPAIKRK